MTRLKRLALGLAAATALALSGTAASAQSADDTVLRVGQLGDVTSLEPYRAPLNNLIFTYNLLAQFLANERATGFTGDLAESWALADDNMSMTLTLREGLTTHDGSPVDTALVRSNFEDRVTVQGKGAAHHNQVAPYFESIEIVDDRTFTLHFSKPAPHFEEIMAIVPVTDPDMFVRDDGSEALANQEDKIISTGPFRLVEYVPDSHMYWEKFDDYWKADEVAIDRIELRFFGNNASMMSALEVGEIDIAWLGTLEDAARLKDNPDYRVWLTDTGASHSIIMVSPENGATRDIRVRQAINLAVNRDAINAAVHAGLANPTSSPVPKHSFAFSESLLLPTGGDPEKARALIAEAGAEGASLSITYPAEDLTSATTAAIIQENLRDIGLDVTLDPAESGVYTDRRVNQDFELLLSLYAGGNIHPAGLTNSFVFSPDVNGFFDDLDEPDPTFVRFSESFQRGMAATSKEAQAEAFVDAMEAIVEGSWVVVLDERPAPIIARSYVDGVTWTLGPRPIFSKVRLGDR